MERISGCGGLIALSKLCIVVALGMGGEYAEAIPRDGNLCVDGLVVAARTGGF
jgi:hypothetical protein